MPSYADLKRKALRLRRQAIKAEIPSQYLAMADTYIDKAIYSRKAVHPVPNYKAWAYERSRSEMLFAIDILEAHTTKRHERYPHHFLRSEINKTGLTE